jgi:hypothetical protein
MAGQSILLQKSKKSTVEEIFHEPVEWQVRIFHETLIEFKEFLDTADLTKTTSITLDILKIDILNIIKGFRKIETEGNLEKIYNQVITLDGILEGLRSMRDTIFQAEGMFQGGELPTNKRAAFYKNMNQCREYAERTLKFFRIPRDISPNNVSNRDKVNTDLQGLNALKIALNDKSAKKRQNTVESIAQINSPESVSLLFQALNDESPLVRLSATRALGKIKHPDVMRALQQGLNDKNSNVRQAAIEALGNFGDQQVISLIREHLNDNSDAVRKAAIDALNKLEVDQNQPADSKRPSVQISNSGNNQPPPETPDATISESSLPISQSEPSEIIRRYGVTEDGLEKHAATDKPVQSVKQDKLDFKIYVNALHSFILSKYTTTPITISIDGPWGTGKSSLMSMLKGKLDPQRDGVRKLFEWFTGLRPWWRWYFGFLKSSIAKWFGKTVISLFVRNDVDDSDVHLYFGETSPRFKKFVSNIVEGFSIDPEVLNQTGSESTSESKGEPTSEQKNETTRESKMDTGARWWAQVHANCEPMQPPYHYAVWLNAWKFDDQEEVWASLALATME